MTMLADRVDAVIGVDTHKHTHTAAVVTPTGGVTAHLTVPSDAVGAKRVAEGGDLQLARPARTGAGQAPIQVSSEEEMRALVAATPGAIGYLPGDPDSEQFQVLRVE